MVRDWIGKVGNASRSLELVCPERGVPSVDAGRIMSRAGLTMSIGFLDTGMFDSDFESSIFWFSFPFALFKSR
jgi:hypothetical protein